MEIIGIPGRRAALAPPAGGRWQQSPCHAPKPDSEDRCLPNRIAAFGEGTYARAVRKATPPQDEKRVLWYLRKIPMLEGVSPARLQDLVAAVEIREIPRRQVIYLPGDPGQAVFFINGGRVKCSKVTRDGKELTLAYRGAGQMFGELAVVDSSPREEMAEAMKNAIITEVPREVFRALLLADAALAFQFACALGERRKQLETKLEHLVFRDVQAKLAALLLELGEEYGVETEEGLQVGLKITHQEMANLIGSTRETISLTLAQFKKKGLLNMDGRTVVLLDLEGLQAAT
jgi:CRP-like cAMP-binding protein